MRRIAVVLLLMAAVTSAACAELCRVEIGDFEPADGGASGGFLYRWPALWLEQDRRDAPICPVMTPDEGRAVEIDTAGAWIDRGWYVYLHRQRYQYLDRSQYLLLEGRADWPRGWPGGIWPDVFFLPVPARTIQARTQPVPEPWTAALLVLGTAVALRPRRTMNARWRSRSEG